MVMMMVMMRDWLRVGRACGNRIVERGRCMIVEWNRIFDGGAVLTSFRNQGYVPCGGRDHLISVVTPCGDWVESAGNGWRGIGENECMMWGKQDGVAVAGSDVSHGYEVVVDCRCDNCVRHDSTIRSGNRHDAMSCYAKVVAIGSSRGNVS